MNSNTCVKAGTGKVEMKEIALGDAGPGEVIVRTLMATVCGSDMHFVDEMEFLPPGTPMGHEAVGIAEQVGRVSRASSRATASPPRAWSAADRVTAAWTATSSSARRSARR